MSLSVGVPLFATVAAVSVFRRPQSSSQLHYSVACSDGVYFVDTPPTQAQDGDSTPQDNAYLDLQPPPSSLASAGVNIAYLPYFSGLIASWPNFTATYTYTRLPSGDPAQLIASLLLYTEWCLGSAVGQCDGIPWQSRVLASLIHSLSTYTWELYDLIDNFYPQPLVPLALNSSRSMEAGNGLTVSDGLYYLTIRAVDRSGAAGIAYSAPFVVDSSALTAGQVTVGPSVAYSLQSQPQTDSVSVTWSNCTDTASGVRSSRTRLARLRSPRTGGAGPT